MRLLPLVPHLTEQMLCTGHHNGRYNQAHQLDSAVTSYVLAVHLRLTGWSVPLEPA